jgi:hypothetical protein
MRRPSTFTFMVLCASLALPACTLLNAPDALPRPPSDSGARDTGTIGSDGGASDAALDPDMDGDAGPGCLAREICFNGASQDDDCDDAVDCDDLDCAGNAACCDTAGSSARLDEPWNAIDDLVWYAATSVDEGSVSTDGGALRFGGDGVLRSIMLDVPDVGCLPLVSGARIAFTANVAGGCVLGDGGVCPDEIAMVLTAATSPLSGRALPADLRVAVGGDGNLRVTSGATPLLRTPASLGTDGRVVVEISPTARDGVRFLSVRVVTFDGGVERQVVANEAFVRQDDLRSCAVTPMSAQRAGGLQLAFEGRGASVTFGGLTASPLACVNPVTFFQAGDVVTAATLPVAGAWNAGGLGAPALLRGRGNELLFYDASNVERDLESVGTLDFSVGAAGAASFRSVMGWDSRPAQDGGAPSPAYLGQTPPTCIGDGCTSRISYREPTAAATWDALGVFPESTFLLGFAREAVEGAYEIAYLEEFFAPTRAPGSAPEGVMALVRPGTECSSVRDPAFAQAGLDAATGLWLFYTCERAGSPSSIRAVTLEERDFVWRAIDGTDREVVSAAVGAYASRGVRGPAPLVRMFPDGAAGATLAVRLWHMALGTDGRRTLALATGQVSVGEIAAVPTSAIPALVGDPASPLLDGSAAVLGSCGGSCDLEDVAVGWRPGTTDLVFMLARSVYSPGSGTARELVPIGQTLERRWWELE